MKWLQDRYGRQIRLTEERELHITTTHPEMNNQLDNIKDTLAQPDSIIQSNSVANVVLYYRHYAQTPVTEKYLCIVVKVTSDDSFVITSYFTDKIKQGVILWQKQ